MAAFHRGDVVVITATGERAVVNRVRKDSLHVTGDSFGRTVDFDHVTPRPDLTPTPRERWNAGL